MSFIQIILLLIFFFGAGCINKEPENTDLFAGKQFWSIKIRKDSREQYSVSGEWIAESKNAIAYREVGAAISRNQILRILNEFENKIVPVANRLFIKPMDINNDNKITLLFLDIDDDSDGHNAFVGGFFQPTNQYPDEIVIRDLGLRSNEQELIYLDTFPGDPNSKDFMATLAHEYQHLLQFSKSFSYNSPQRKVEPNWIDEGLSEITSDLTGYGPQIARLQNFNEVFGNSLFSFNDELADYAHLYAYFRYLYNVTGEKGISTIFHEEEIGSKGIHNALSHLDPNLFDCGIEHQRSAFICSYMAFWASVFKKEKLKGYFSSNKRIDWLLPDTPFLIKKSGDPWKENQPKLTYPRPFTSKIQLSMEEKQKVFAPIPLYRSSMEKLKPNWALVEIKEGFNIAFYSDFKYEDEEIKRKSRKSFCNSVLNIVYHNLNVF